MKKIMAVLMIILSIGFITGCTESEPEIKAKYTIWIGGDIVQIGHQTHEYETKDGMITFRNFKTGKTITVPLSNVGSIEIN
jgi:hypothetical protein